MIYNSSNFPGLTNLFNSEIYKPSHVKQNEENKSSNERDILTILKQHAVEMYTNIGKLHLDWNEKRQNEGQM